MQLSGSRVPTAGTEAQIQYTLTLGKLQAERNARDSRMKNLIQVIAEESTDLARGSSFNRHNALNAMRAA